MVLETNLLLFIMLGNVMNYRTEKHHALSQGLGHKIKEYSQICWGSQINI